MTLTTYSNGPSVITPCNDVNPATPSTPHSQSEDRGSTPRGGTSQHQQGKEVVTEPARENGEPSNKIVQQNRRTLPNVPRPGRPRADVPTAGLRRRRNGRCYVFWRWRGRVYELSLGRLPAREATTRQLEVQLALRTGEWPLWARQMTPAARYLSSLISKPSDDILARYGDHLRGEASESWACTSLAHLRELQAVSGKPLQHVTPADAQAYLDHILRTKGPWLKGRKHNRTRATRNRARAACGRFYRWAVQSGLIVSSPFASTRILPVDDVEHIVHLAREERDAVLAASKQDHLGIAVWLALYTGMRLGEVIRCEWGDIDLRRRKLDVPKTKTRRRRIVDLARPLIAELQRVPAKRRSGPVVPWAAGVTPKHQAALLCERIAASTDCKDIVAGAIAWNSFRHTFASLLVQAGVSLFKVSSWLGNSSEVCRRHYAAMMPSHDKDIDRLR